jgi:predicted permease
MNALVVLFIISLLVALFIIWLWASIYFRDYPKLTDDKERQAQTLAGFSAAINCLALNASGSLILKNVIFFGDIIVAGLLAIGVWILVLSDYKHLKKREKYVKFVLNIKIGYIVLGLGIANVGNKLVNYNQIKNVPFATLIFIFIGFAFCGYGILRNWKNNL